MQSAIDSDDLYRNYDAYKGWSDLPVQVPPEVQQNILDIAGRHGKLRILEIGFGDGGFLDWAASAGHQVTGFEIRPEAVDAARSRGHEAYVGSAQIPPVDLIVALDVLEHLSDEQLLDFFSSADRHLLPKGRIVARFPNGSSPFFGHFQYGDRTHQRPLNADMLKQVSMLRGFAVVHAANPRPVPQGFGAKVKFRLAYLIRDVFETVVGLAYFGHRMPMDPNIVVVLERSKVG